MAVREGLDPLAHALGFHGTPQSVIRIPTRQQAHQVLFVATGCVSKRIRPSNVTNPES